MFWSLNYRFNYDELSLDVRMNLQSRSCFGKKQDSLEMWSKSGVYWKQHETISVFFPVSKEWKMSSYRDCEAVE